MMSDNDDNDIGFLVLFNNNKLKQDQTTLIFAAHFVLFRLE